MSHPERNILIGLLGLSLASVACFGGGGGSGESLPWKPQYLYVANRDSNDVTAFEVAQDGTLTFVQRTPAGKAPNAVVTDSWNLFVANSGDNTISCYKIGEKGKLTLASTVPTGSTPVALDGYGASNVFALIKVVCAGSNEYIEYRINNGPTLVEKGRHSMASPTDVISGSVNDIVANGSANTLTRINQESLSVPGAATASGKNVVHLQHRQYAPSSIDAGDVNGTSRLLALSTDDNTITTFQEDTSTPQGTLKKLGSVTTGVKPIKLSAVYAHLDGHRPSSHSYTLNRGSETISTFNDADVPVRVSGTDPSSGPLPTDLIQTLEYKSIKPILYVTTEGGNVRHYTVDDKGVPVFVDQIATQGTTPAAMAITNFYAGQSTLAITSTPPDGTLGVAYDSTLTATSPANDLTFVVSSGLLPDGLSLKKNADNTFHIAGTPTKAGSFTFTVTAASVYQLVAKTFTVTINATAATADLRVLNVATDADDSGMAVTVGSISFPSNPFGVLSVAKSVASPGAVNCHIMNTAGQNWLDTTITTFANCRNILVPLGAIAADRKVTFCAFPSAFPPAGKGALSFINGIPTRDLTAVDVYLLDGAGTELDHKLNLTYGGFSSFTVAPGGYRLRVNTAGVPGDVIATSAVQTVADGESYLEVVDSPEGLAAAFVVAKEK